MEQREEEEVTLKNRQVKTGKMEMNNNEVENKKRKGEENKKGGNINNANIAHEKRKMWK